jgi:hypothetical protein
MKFPSTTAGVGLLLALPLLAGCHHQEAKSPAGPEGSGMNLGQGHLADPRMEDVLKGGRGYQGPRRGGVVSPGLKLGSGRLSDSGMEGVLRGGEGYQGPRTPPR